MTDAGAETPAQAPALRLGDFLKDSLDLGDAEFAAVHGEAFLLRSAYHPGLRALPDDARTLPCRTPSPEQARFRPELDFQVFPVRKRAQPNLPPGAGHDGAAPPYISVGRTPKNDVVIPDASLTAIQAFLRRSEDGRFLLLDAASKNGSYVDDTPAPVWGQADPVEIHSGARLRFGAVDFTFLDAASFRLLVRHLARG